MADADKLIAADASATRAFFVDMLVRDIGVEAAILDLVDNAVDAAYLRAKPPESLDPYFVDVTINADRFEIRDNCGGIDTGTARDYAFRFGRAPGFNPDSRIGEFGIGMKRAVFRLGRKFRVESSTAVDSFFVDVDVDEWRGQSGAWTFPMVVSDPSGDPGTKVEVNQLHQSVKELFARAEYSRRVVGEIADRHSEALRKGIQITVNNSPADSRLHELLVGSGIAPERQEEELISNRHAVRLRIVAGIGPARRPVAESGWYVYCNGRLVLKADRTSLTGWGTGDTDQTGGIPAWHSQYARFRGFVFFESDYPGALPWTTTKSEIDESSDVYQNALGKMRSIIRRFADFTNSLKEERDRYEESEGDASLTIESSLGKAALTPVGDIQIGSFSVPDQKEKRGRAESGPKMATVQFKAQAAQVRELKSAFKLKTNRQVGELAFTRLYEEEIA
ncbi:MAG: ATP-binding protein [Chloroflexi bacterium]|nr:ATP-binding protein [Chloroflexota bacterium]